MSSGWLLRIGLVGGAVVVLIGGLAWWWTRPVPGDARLAAFVRARPSVPIVFTSRSSTASFAAAAPEGEGFTSPGQPLWAASEGRLRLLTPAGAVHELTWGKPLPGGDTLVDVMSPSISLDGKRVLFAGRTDGEPGRFRLYETGLDGRGLRALTGGADDDGCVSLPPLRWRDGKVMPDTERRAIDYDDVDPIELNTADRQIVFASSRTPDLGRDHARRSTTLWLLSPKGRKSPLTANRNNDRWPFLLRSKYIAFSLWSRNREVVAADRLGIVPYSADMKAATAPTDAWQGAFTQVPGGHFGMLVKPDLPVWRPRPLFANRITFMTSLADAPLTVVQVPPGLIASVPSARGRDAPLPRAESTFLRRGPRRDVKGQPLWLATPGPCPPAHVLLAGASASAGAPEPGTYGIYLARDDWPDDASAEGIGLTLLFDDPALVDAEPVAVYARKLPLATTEPKSPASPSRGTQGHVFATALDAPTLMGDLPGQRTDAGQGPIFDAPPPGSIDHLRIYAARRDRFDDPDRPRIPGGWEWLLTVPVKQGAASTLAPTDAPTVLAGFDKKGQVVTWKTAARDKAGNQASFFAYAGDHYSLTQPGGRHFCVGCHPGHSGFSSAHHDHAERLE